MGETGQVRLSGDPRHGLVRHDNDTARDGPAATSPAGSPGGSPGISSGSYTLTDPDSPGTSRPRSFERPPRQPQEEEGLSPSGSRRRMRRKNSDSEDTLVGEEVSEGKGEEGKDLDEKRRKEQEGHSAGQDEEMQSVIIKYVYRDGSSRMKSIDDDDDDDDDDDPKKNVSEYTERTFSKAEDGSRAPTPVAAAVTRPTPDRTSSDWGTPSTAAASWVPKGEDDDSRSGTPSSDMLELETVLYNNGLVLRSKEEGGLAWDFDSPACGHPRNWPMGRKAWNFAVIVLAQTFVLAMSSVATPISGRVEEELGISTMTASFVFTSVYLFGQAVGVIIAPASESFGRKRVNVGGMFLFGCFNLILGLRPGVPVVALCRFATGILAAIPMNGIFGSMAELWNYKDRLWIGWLGALAANAGIIMGPVFTEWILDTMEWNWVFTIATGMSFLLTVVLCTTHESRPSKLLRDRTNRIREMLRRPDTLPVSHPDHVAGIGHFFRHHMARPFRLLVSERLILVTSVLIGSSFAMIFMALEAIPYIFREFHLDPNMRILPFFGLAFGLVFSTYTRMYDHFEISRCLDRGIPLTPELKLVGFMIGSWVFAVGLWTFSWTIPPWAADGPMPATVALTMIGYGINEFDTVLTGYLMDAYLSYAGSALAALNFFRTVTIGLCSVFAHDLFKRLNWNVAGSVLAGAATLFCVAPPLYVRFGERIRARSKFAVFSAVITLEERLAGGSTLTRAGSARRPRSPEEMI